MDRKEVQQILYRALGETMSQTLLLTSPGGAVLARAGAALAGEEQLGVLLAQITAAFQHITGRGSIYRSMFFAYQDETGRYALVSQERRPFLAAVYQGRVHLPPPLGLTRFLLRKVYQRVLALWEDAEGRLPEESAPVPPSQPGVAFSQPQGLGWTEQRVETGPPELQEALQRALSETRASLILAADDSGAVVSATGESEHPPSMIGALAAASLAAFREVERLTGSAMRNAYALLEGSRNAVLILKEEKQPLVFVAVVPRRPGQSLGLARLVLVRLARRAWRIERTSSLSQLGLDPQALPSTGELPLLDWGDEPEPLVSE